MQFEDREIIEKVLAGDQGQYALLVNRYKGLVFSLVMKYVKGREDAEEVAQDVFIKAYKNLASFKGESKFSTWLYTVAVTTSISFLRKNNLHTQELKEEIVESVGGGMRADTIEQKSRSRMVQEGIAMLSPEDAMVLTLFYNGEQSLEEMAKVLGKEVNATKVQLHRARGRLKEKLNTYFKAEVKDLY